MKSLKAQKASGNQTFLHIQENQFPHIFQDPVLTSQKLEDFNEEIDYDSGAELVAKNKKQLLKSLTNSIWRVVTENPLNYIENVKVCQELDQAEIDRKAK